MKNSHVDLDEASFLNVYHDHGVIVAGAIPRPQFYRSITIHDRYLNKVSVSALL